MERRRSCVGWRRSCTATHINAPRDCPVLVGRLILIPKVSQNDRISKLLTIVAICSHHLFHLVSGMDCNKLKKSSTAFFHAFPTASWVLIMGGTCARMVVGWNLVSTYANFPQFPKHIQSTHRWIKAYTVYSPNVLEKGMRRGGGRFRVFWHSLASEVYQNLY